MRYTLTILLLWTLTSVKSQTVDLIGIYQIDWSGPSYRYLSLDCDSTYHFITHWDFGGKKDVEPAMTEKKKWRIEGQSKLVFEEPFYSIKSLDVMPDWRLKGKNKKEINTWTKIIEFNDDCQVKTYTENHSATYYSLTRFQPGLIIKSSDSFQNNKLKKRVTYYELSEAEIKDYVLSKSFKRTVKYDPVMEIKLKIAEYEMYWPVEKIEKWDNDQLSVTLFDKNGQEIK